MAKKSTKAQVEQRIKTIYEMLLSDTSYTNIVRYCTKNWGVSTRMVDKYVQRANNLIIEEVAELRQNALEKHIAQRTMLANKALKNNDLRLALEVWRDLAKLEGLYPSGKLEVTTRDITDEQRISRVDALLNSARERRDRLAN